MMSESNWRFSLSVKFFLQIIMLSFLSINGSAPEISLIGITATPSFVNFIQ
jgi:hypothetical protein